MAIGNKFRHPTDAIAIALASFKGNKKTIFLSDKTDDLVYIDDYHPTEINAVYQAVGNYILLKSSCLFQPHLFSRTKDFADDFCQSLSQFDEYC
jgi:UDP-N-acetylmuramate--alanine ligase